MSKPHRRRCVRFPICERPLDCARAAPERAILGGSVPEAATAACVVFSCIWWRLTGAMCKGCHALRGVSPCRGGSPLVCG